LKKRPIKFKTDADTYFDLAEDALDAGDYINAVFHFHNAYLKGGGADALFFLGETYTDIGEYDEALYYLFKALDKRPDCPDINGAIAACFLSMNDEDTAIFYTWTGMSMKDYNDMMYEKDVEIYNESNKKIRLLEKNDKMLLDIATKLLSTGDRTYAKELLQTVKPESDEFLRSCNLLIMIALDDKKVAEALEIIELGLRQNEGKKESGVHLEFRCWAIVAYHLLKDKENKQAAIDIVEKASLDYHASRAAVFAYSRINDYKRAGRHIEAILKENPYSKGMRIMLALANYLCGKFDEAKNEIVAAAKLYPNDISIKEVAGAISQRRKGLSLTTLIDKRTTANWIDDVEENLELIKKGRYEDVPDKAGFRQKLEWIFQSHLNSLATYAILIISKLDEFKQFLLDKLIDYHLEMPVRKVVLYSVLMNYPVNKPGIVMEGFYQRISFRRLKVANEMVFRAYCKTFSTLIFMENGFETRLYNAAKKIEERFSDLRIRENEESDILAAMMFALSTKSKLPPAHIAFIFSCDEKVLLGKLNKIRSK